MDEETFAQKSKDFREKNPELFSDSGIRPDEVCVGTVTQTEGAVVAQMTLKRKGINSIRIPWENGGASPVFVSLREFLEAGERG